ncbi:MAG: hypothetical protein AAFZ15_32395 [Bacteroidota bacterium]
MQTVSIIEIKTTKLFVSRRAVKSDLQKGKKIYVPKLNGGYAIMKFEEEKNGEFIFQDTGGAFLNYPAAFLKNFYLPIKKEQ